MAKGWKLLEGVVMADLAVESNGKDVNTLFENSALAVESIMVDTKTVKKSTPRDISLEKETIEDLLYAFLNELVYLKDAEQLLFSEFKIVVSKNSGWLLHAHLKGDKINPKMKLGTDIKAITLHKFEVVKGWKARFVVDV